MDHPDQTTLPEVAATALLGGDVPRPSDTTAPPAGGAPAAGLLDVNGVAWDRTKHQVDVFGNPKKTAKGAWAKITGNGARKAKGLAPSGNLVHGAMPVEPAAAAPAPAAPQAAAASGSQLNPAPKADPAAAAGGDVRDAQLLGTGDQVPMSPEECVPTAEAIVDGSTGIAAMYDGEHWRPEPGERKQLVDALARLWAEYRLPRLGPVVSLVMILVAFIGRGEKRREAIQRLWQWATGKRLERDQVEAPR